MKEPKDAYTDRLFDEALRYAGQQALEDLYDECAADDGAELPIPDELDAQIQALIAAERAKEQAQQKKKRRRKRLGYLAASVAATFIIGSVCITSVDAWRVRFFNFVLEVTDGAIDFRLDSGDNGAKKIKDKDAENIAFRPTYLPEGFALEEVESAPSKISLVFRNNKSEHVSFQWYLSENALITEYADEDKEPIEIGDKKGFIVRKEDKITVLWQDGEAAFRVSGNIAEEEIIKTAKSVT